MKILVDNLVIEYSDLNQNNEKVLICLHGWGSGKQSFDDLANKLSIDFRVISIDLPGFGGSEMFLDFDLDKYVKIVSIFCKKLDVSPYCFIGHSFGGRIIIRGTAQKYFDSQKIILIASAGVEDFSYKKNILNILSKFFGFILFIPPLIFFRKKIRNIFYKIIGSDFLEQGRMQNIFKKVVSLNLNKDASEIQKETLIIWGNKDKTTPLSSAFLLNKLIKNSKIEIIDSALHFVHETHKAEVYNLVFNFLNK